MNEIKLTLTQEELEDIRMALIAKWFDSRDDEHKAARLDALANKLAHAAVFGNA